VKTDKASLIADSKSFLSSICTDSQTKSQVVEEVFANASQLNREAKSVLAVCIQKNNRLLFKNKALTGELENRKIIIAQKKEQVLKVQDELEKLSKKQGAQPTPARLSNYYLQKLLSVTQDRSSNLNPTHPKDKTSESIKLSRSFDFNDTIQSKNSSHLKSTGGNFTSPSKEAKVSQEKIDGYLFQGEGSTVNKSTPQKVIAAPVPKRIGKSPDITKPFSALDASLNSAPNRPKVNSSGGMFGIFGFGSSSATNITQDNRPDIGRSPPRAIEKEDLNRVYMPEIRVPVEKKTDMSFTDQNNGMFEKLNKWLINKIVPKGSKE